MGKPFSRGWISKSGVGPRDTPKPGGMRGCATLSLTKVRINFLRTFQNGVKLGNIELFLMMYCQHVGILLIKNTHAPLEVACRPLDVAVGALKVAFISATKKEKKPT